jgi:hypothetical protein
MRFSLDVPWHHHEMELAWLTADEVRGYVCIDWSHGAPDADARVHRVPFAACIADGAWRFAVTVGTSLPRVYRFELWPVGGTLTGVVDVTVDRAGARTLRLGVLAR